MQSFRKIVGKFFEIMKTFEFSGNIYPYNCKRLGEGPYPLLDCQSLSKRDGHLGSGPRGLWVFRDLWRKRGQPRQLMFGECGPTRFAARSSSHSLRYFAVRSDWVRWLMEAHFSVCCAFRLTHLRFCLLRHYDVAQCKRSVAFRQRWTSVY